MSTSAVVSDLVSVVIPAYNEAEAIVGVLEETRRALAELPCSSEIIVVDDGSTDATASLVEQQPDVRLVRNPVNLGYGHSLMRGLAVARGELIAICDADGSYPIASIGELFALAQRGADHVIGVRTGAHLSSYGSLRHVYRWLCSYVVGQPVPDANSGLRLFRREVAENVLADLCRGFSFTTSLTLASVLSGYVVAFTPIPFRERTGRSHVRLRDALRTAQYLFQLIAVYNPVKVFLPLVATAVLGAILTFALALIHPWSLWGLLAGIMGATSLLLVGLTAHACLLARLGLRPKLPAPHAASEAPVAPVAPAPARRKRS